MTEEEKKDIANCISSLLTSTTRRMTLGQLLRDYRETVGEEIPYRKFGCNHVEDFIRILRDKVELCGTGLHAEVRVVISEKTAHINDLISKQRVAKPKNQRSRNGYIANRRRPFSSNYFRDNFNSPPPPWRNTRQPVFKPFMQQHVDKPLVQQPVIKPLIGQHVDKPLVQQPVIKPLMESPIVERVDRNSEAVGLAVKTGAVPKAAIPKKVNKPAEHVFYSEDDDDDESDDVNTKVPQYIQENLKKLILKHPEGVWCSNLIEFYKKDYGKFLHFTDYGYRSIAQMCVDLRKIFHVIKLEDDIKIFSREHTIPQTTMNVISKLQLQKMKASAEKPTEPALPEGDIEEMMGAIYTAKFPPDAVQFGAKLERQWLEPGTTEQDYIDVHVGEVYDPSKFWIYMKLYACQLDTLMANLHVFYTHHKDELLVPYLALRKDMYIACIFRANNIPEYHRARIVDTTRKHEGIVKVFFIDYGTVSVITLETICYLHRQFADLPEQAIRARLAGIYPPTENEQWSRVVASDFLAFVANKSLVAQIVHIDEERQELDLILADTTEEDEDFFINDALVQMGHAAFTFQDRLPAQPSSIVPVVRYIHLFPTFQELEDGLVPTALQTITMLQAGLCIEQAYPHYYKDAVTGKPITIGCTPINLNDMNINYDADQLHDEEDYYDEEEYDDQTKEDYVADDSNSVSTLKWSDLIDNSNEEKELEDSNIELTNNENLIKSPTNSISIQTDEIVESKEIANNTNIKSLKNDTTQTEILANTNDNNQLRAIKTYTDDTSDLPIIKKPVRPPPGYNVTPQNVTINYNCNGPNNYLASQTCINVPMMPQQQTQHAYPSYVDPMQQKFYYINYLNSLVARGFPLTPEQNAYYYKELCGLLTQNMYSGATPPGCPNYAPMQTNYPYSEHANGGNYNNYTYNEATPNYRQQYVNPFTNLAQENRNSSVNKAYSTISNFQPTAKEFIPRNYPSNPFTLLVSKENSSERISPSIEIAEVPRLSRVSDRSNILSTLRNIEIKTAASDSTEIVSTSVDGAVVSNLSTVSDISNILSTVKDVEIKTALGDSTESVSACIEGAVVSNLSAVNDRSNILSTVKDVEIETATGDSIKSISTSIEGAVLSNFSAVSDRSEILSTVKNDEIKTATGDSIKSISTSIEGTVLSNLSPVNDRSDILSTVKNVEIITATDDSIKSISTSIEGAVVSNLSPVNARNDILSTAKNAEIKTTTGDSTESFSTSIEGAVVSTLSPVNDRSDILSTVKNVNIKTATDDSIESIVTSIEGAVVSNLSALSDILSAVRDGENKTDAGDVSKTPNPTNTKNNNTSEDGAVLEEFAKLEVDDTTQIDTKIKVFFQEQNQELDVISIDGSTDDDEEVFLENDDNRTVSSYTTVKSGDNYNISEEEFSDEYDDCDSHDDNDGRRTAIFQENETISPKSKFIKMIGSQELMFHVIHYDGNFYFLLTEVSMKLCGKSLTALQIRRLSVGMPLRISLLDIRLMNNPELKEELILYGLISQTDISVDGVPIKYLIELSKILPINLKDAAAITNKLNRLLQEVDFFITTHT